VYLRVDKKMNCEIKRIALPDGVKYDKMKYTRDQQLEQVSAKMVKLVTSLRKVGIGTDKIKQEDLERPEAKKEKLEQRKEDEIKNHSHHEDKATHCNHLLAFIIFGI
jgi:hypothetical protein